MADPTGPSRWHATSSRDRGRCAPTPPPRPASRSLARSTAVLLRVSDASATGPRRGEGDDDLSRPHRPPRVGEAQGINIHADVIAGGDDPAGCERLFCYCARVPLSLERLSLLSDGRIAYRLRRPSRRGQTHRIMTPVQFLARIVALIPTITSEGT